MTRAESALGAYLAGERDRPEPSSGAVAREITGGHQDRERRPGARALAGSLRPGMDASVSLENMR